MHAGDAQADGCPFKAGMGGQLKGCGGANSKGL